MSTDDALVALAGLISKAMVVSDARGCRNSVFDFGVMMVVAVMTRCVDVDILAVTFLPNQLTKPG